MSRASTSPQLKSSNKQWPHPVSTAIPTVFPKHVIQHSPPTAKQLLKLWASCIRNHLQAYTARDSWASWVELIPETISMSTSGDTCVHSKPLVYIHTLTIKDLGCSLPIDQNLKGQGHSFDAGNWSTVLDSARVVLWCIDMALHVEKCRFTIHGNSSWPLELFTWRSLWKQLDRRISVVNENYHPVDFCCFN